MKSVSITDMNHSSFFMQKMSEENQTDENVCKTSV